MDSTIDFSALWKQQSSTAPAVNELIGKAKTLKHKTKNKFVGVSVLLIATTVFILITATHLHPKLVTTTLGIIIMVLSIALSLVYFANVIWDLLKKQEGTSSAAYLQQLISLKQKQERIQRTLMSVYFIGLSVGLALYMFEYTLQMKILWAIITYTATAAWIAFNWFFLRPRVVKKQENEINTLIADFKRINEQLSEN